MITILHKTKNILASLDPVMAERGGTVQSLEDELSVGGRLPNLF